MKNNKATGSGGGNNDTVSLLDCVNENLSEVESSDSDNEESDPKSGMAVKGTPAVGG
jgi:hypothetical protein